MFSKLEWTYSTAQQNKKQLQNPTKVVTAKNEPTTTEPPPKSGHQRKPLCVCVCGGGGGGGGLNAFYWYQIFALDSVVVEGPKNVKLAWKLPNNCNVSTWRNNLIKLTHYDGTKKIRKWLMTHR